MPKVWRLRWYLLFVLTSLTLAVNLVLAFLMSADWAIMGQAVALVLFLASGVVFYFENRRNDEHRRVLLEVGQELASRAELDELLRYIVDAILKLVPQADKCVVHLLDEAGRRLYPRYSSHPAWELSVGMPANKGVAGSALTERRTKVVNDTREDLEFLPLRSSAQLRSLMVAPLIAQGKPLGTISLNSRVPGAFTERDRALVTALAAQASAAIYQNQLYAKALSEAHYIEALINNLADGLLVLDAEGRVLRYNPSLAHILGVDVSHIVGQRVDAQSEEENLRRLAVILGDLPRDGRQSFERQVELDEPIHANLRIHASSVLDQRGNVEWIVLFHDQTEEVEQARTRTQLIQALVQDIRPSLESVRGYTALLLAHDLPRQGNVFRWAEQIRFEGMRLLRLAEGLDDLCALEAGHLEIGAEPTHVNELISEVLDELKQPLQRKQLSTEIQCPPDLPRLPLDRERLGYVLWSLLENAVQRAHMGGCISLRVEASLEELSFILVDDGYPVPAEVRTRALQGLYRLDPLLTKGPSGTGLSLYVARKIVEAYGGHLWLAENDGRGAKFQFIIPLTASR